MTEVVFKVGDREFRAEFDSEAAAESAVRLLACWIARDGTERTFRELIAIAAQSAASGVDGWHLVGERDG